MTSSIKVLTIDDDPAMTDLLGLLLKSHGLEVISTNDGFRGIELAKTENPDIIILDLMMPGIDGWEICKQVRAFSKVPIAILSALDDPAMIASTLDAGADDFMVKPVATGVLIAHINNLTRRSLVESDKSTMLRQTGSLHDTGVLKAKQNPLQA